MLSAYDMITRRGKLPTLKHSQWEVAREPFTWHQGLVLPIGTKYRIFETKNFGFMVLASSQIGETNMYVNSIFFRV